MSEGNRFSGLMGELKGGDKPDSKPAPKKAKSRRKKAAKVETDATATNKDKADEPMPRGTKNSLAKYKDPDYEKGTYYLKKKTTHKMRIYAATRKLEMSELVEKAVREYMVNNPVEDED